MSTPYTVVTGDTMASIAQANGLTWQALYAAQDAAFHVKHPKSADGTDDESHTMVMLHAGDVVTIP